MRQIDIISIIPSTEPGVPSRLVLSGDVLQLFHGREWIDPAGGRVPLATYSTAAGAPNPPPLGVKELPATTFRVEGNADFSGAYTVYTGALPSVEVIGGNTVVRVTTSLSTDPDNDVSSGYVTNLSTYLIEPFDDPAFVILEQQFADRSVDIPGRLYSGWGEIYANNFARVVQNFAGPVPPARPFFGQFWFDTTIQTAKVCVDSDAANDFSSPTWIAINNRYEHVQSVPATTWVVNHNFGKQLVNIQVIVNTPAGPKVMLPSDITFTSSNSLTITFTSAESGNALVTW